MSSATQIVGQADSNAAQTSGNSIPAMVTAPIAPNTFVFWAGFNGTNNMSSNPTYSGDVQTTEHAGSGLALRHFNLTHASAHSKPGRPANERRASGGDKSQVDFGF